MRFPIPKFILASFEVGRKFKWARAHFFVGCESEAPLGFSGVSEPLANKGFRVSMNLDRIREAAERVARSVGVEVVDVEWQVGKQRLLRLYIDRPPLPGQGAGSGISHSDCEAVSEQLTVILDVEDLVLGPAYILEVSSPGLDRKLLKPSDYERFAGRLVKVWLNEPVENTKSFEGRLGGFADGVVQMSVHDREISFPLAKVRKANLVVEF